MVLLETKVNRATASNFILDIKVKSDYLRFHKKFQKISGEETRNGLDSCALRRCGGYVYE
ncbi:hypothetical protein FWJ32_12890 [Calorimonas adulescens]|uniref:Uncharacterized protein n=1 Tax=Calorimonas adulescens TaxID=2606906 RepID=A0A5D8Q741_9THEO|nr:hypothetical protein FWJ32_12890 [Calorimonas adulescens]